MVGIWNYHMSQTTNQAHFLGDKNETPFKTESTLRSCENGALKVKIDVFSRPNTDQKLTSTDQNFRENEKTICVSFRQKKPFLKISPRLRDTKRFQKVSSINYF